MRSLGRIATAVMLLVTLTSTATAVNRDTLASLEKSFDDRISSVYIDDPFDLLGNTRGVYLDDYGAVFTAELNLVAGAVVTPFRPAFTDEQKEQLRKKKISRLADVKAIMRSMLVDSGATLTTIPADQQIVVGVSLFYYSWESRAELPSQIVMRAGRQVLADYSAGRVTGAALDSAIQVQEF